MSICHLPKELKGPQGVCKSPSHYPFRCKSMRWALRCQELGIGALHIKLRATGGTKTRTPGGLSSQCEMNGMVQGCLWNCKLYLIRFIRQGEAGSGFSSLLGVLEDRRPWCSKRSPCVGTFWHEDWPNRGGLGSQSCSWICIKALARAPESN